MQELIAKLSTVLAPQVAVSYAPEIDSTSSELKRRTVRGELAGPTLLIAGYQSAGRGTRGREWLMPRPPDPLRPRDIALTVAWPKSAGPPDPRLSLAVAAIVAQCVEHTLIRQHELTPDGSGLEPWRICVKWPNDLVCPASSGSARPRVSDWSAANVATTEFRKTGGILLESSGQWLFAGIGINVNSQARDFAAELRGRATTLATQLALAPQLADGAIAPVIEIASLLEALCLSLARLLIGNLDLAPLLSAWRQRDVTGGTRYTLVRDGASIPVVAGYVKLDTGELVCCDADGASYCVLSYADLQPAADDNP